jgi:hypothetical protein
MCRIDRWAFRDAYRRAVNEIHPFLSRERLAVIARHNLGLHPDRHDVLRYLHASEARYLLAIDRFNQQSSSNDTELSALDVGGFFAAFPLALARVGVKVTLVEEYGYYHGAFDDLKRFVERQGVEVWAADFTQPGIDTRGRNYSFVTNMAMLEHLPSSPKALLENIGACLDHRGILIVEVPNIAYWPNRLRALRGQSIHQPFDDYYASEPPWIGHHREYTVEEVRNLLAWSGFEIKTLDVHNYSLTLTAGTWFDRLYTLLVYLWPTLLFANCREVIMATATPAPQGGRPSPTEAPRQLPST